MSLGRTLVLLLSSGLGAIAAGMLVFNLLWLNPILEGSGKGGLGILCLATAIAALIGGVIPGYFCVRYFRTP